MAPRNPERAEAVKLLRAIAWRAGVARTTDNASRAKVTAMYETTLAAPELAEQDRADAEAAWEAYGRTWSQPEEPDDPQVGPVDVGAASAPRGVVLARRPTHVQLEGR